MKNPTKITAVLASLFLFLTACAPNNATPSPTTGSPTASVTSSATSSSTESVPTLKTMETNLGLILVGGNGRSVYVFTQDKKDSGVRSCIDLCLKSWPPVLVETTPMLASDVKATIGTIPGPEGKKQVTVDGMPVYYWYEDEKPGDTKGQGTGNVWFVVDPNGTIVKTPQPTSSSTNPTPTKEILPEDKITTPVY